MPNALPDPARSAQNARAGIVMTLVLAGLAMIGPFTVDTVFPAFTAIGKDLNADTVQMQQVVSTYLLSLAVMSVLHGPISDAVGRKPVILAGLVGYVGATVLCAVAWSLPVLLLGRALQGACAGAGTIVSRALVRDLYDGAEAQRLMAHIMMLFSLAPAVAPVIGGVILGWGPWPWIFWFVGGYAIVMIVATIVVLPETLPASQRRPLRVNSVVGSLWAVARNWEFERLAMATAFMFSAHFIYIAAAPIIMVDLLGKGERDFWMLFLPVITGMIIGSWVAGRIAHVVSRDRLVGTALVFTVISAAINVLVTSISPTLPWAVIGPGVIAFGIALIFPVLQLELIDLFPRQRGAAASMGTFASLAFNAFLAGAIAPVVTGSLAQTAWTALGFAVLGGCLWWWHHHDRVRWTRG